MGNNEYDISVSIFDNIFNKKKRRVIEEEEDVVDDHNEYLANLGQE